MVDTKAFIDSRQSLAWIGFMFNRLINKTCVRMDLHEFRRYVDKWGKR